jgi:two-component system, OmpR family, catabolic regulation response regulator CreB
MMHDTLFSSRRQVLVIEDEPAVADALVYALQTDGFTPHWAATWKEGWVAFEQQSPDLIILDVGLPDGDGRELCRAIRRTSAVPIIFLTARNEEVERIVGLEIGADDYITKPFSPREVTARVRAILRRGMASATVAPPAPSGPFQVDPERQRISYFGVPLELTRLEYRILSLLIARPGCIFSREQIMNLAWDEPEASLERTVDAHIKALRALLHGVRPEINPITTHRGVGYALREVW